MFIESMTHILALDLNWLVWLITNNLHWLFALMCFVILAEKSKKPIWTFIVLIGLLYAFVDVMDLGGWIMAPMLIVLPFQLFIGLFFPEGSIFQKKFAIIATIFIFVASFINTFYFRFV